MSARKFSHRTIFLIVSNGSPLALIASSLRSTSKKPVCPMTRSLDPPMAHCGQRVRFVATWREEFFEVPNGIPAHVRAQGSPRAYAERQVAKAKAKIQPSTKSSLLPIQSTAEFISNFVPPEYLVYGLIQRRFIYSMTGPTGEGKTSVALLIALLVDRGQALNGREI